MKTEIKAAGLSAEEIEGLSPQRAREWILYHKYKIVKCKNDLRFHLDKTRELKEYLKKIGFARVRIPRIKLSDI